MSNEKIDKLKGLEKTCVWQEFGNGNVSSENSSCIDCNDCYLPKNMSPEKKELYRNACNAINSYGPVYKSG